MQWITLGEQLDSEELRKPWFLAVPGLLSEDVLLFCKLEQIYTPHIIALHLHKMQLDHKKRGCASFSFFFISSQYGSPSICQ